MHGPLWVYSAWHYLPIRSGDRVIKCEADHALKPVSTLFLWVCVLVCASQSVSKHPFLPQCELLSRELSDQKQKLMQLFILVSALPCKWKQLSRANHGFHGYPEYLGWIRSVCQGYCRLWGMMCERSTLCGLSRSPQLSENKTGRQHGFVLEFLNSPPWGSCCGLPLSIIPVLNISRHSCVSHGYLPQDV